MKKLGLIILCFSWILDLTAQTKEYKKAMDLYSLFIKEGKVGDINKAFELANNNLSDPSNIKLDNVHFYFGLITKQYYESNIKTIKNRHELVGNTFQAFKTTYQINKNFSQKDNLMKLIQILGYDLNAEGISQYKIKNYEEAYKLQKKLIEAQTILAENKMDFTISAKDGTKSTLPSSDIINNLVVFCMNVGKKDEAKAFMEKDLGLNPSVIKYLQFIQLCGQLGDTDLKNKYTDIVVSKFPNDEDVMILDINRNIELKKTSIALDKIEQAKKTTSNPLIFLIGSQLYGELENNTQALALLKEGLLKFPNDFDMNYNYGTMLFNSALVEINQDQNRTNSKGKGFEKVEEAKNYFLKAKSINPDKVNIDKVLKDIESIK